MREKKTITVKVDTELLKQATEKIEKLGLDMNTIINRFINEIIINNGLPFDTNNKK